MEARDFLVEFLRKDVNAGLVGVAVLPEFELGEGLVAEARTHDEARVSGSTTQVHKASLGKKEDLVAVREGVLVDLGLDVGPLDRCISLKFVDLDLVVEVSDVADDSLVLHAFHVLEGNHTDVAGGGDVDVRAAECVFKRGDLVAFHGGLEGVDGIDLRDDDACSLSAKGLGAPLADIAVAADNGDLT